MYDKLKLLYPRTRGTPDISGYLDKAKEQTDLKTGEVCTFGSLDGLKVSIYTGGYSIQIRNFLPYLLYRELINTLTRIFLARTKHYTRECRLVRAIRVMLSLQT